MAKISAHGQEIGRIEYTTFTKAYFADGKILKNSGFGWKIHGKVKAGFQPREVFEQAKARQEKILADRPAFAEYRRLLHDACGLSKRWKLAQAIEHMPHDPDGVWSDACDGYGDNVSLDVSEVVTICNAYLAAVSEAKERKAESEERQ